MCVWGGGVCVHARVCVCVCARARAKQVIIICLTQCVCSTCILCISCNDDDVELNVLGCRLTY